MERKSNTVFKMKGYSYPGTGPMTKRAGPEGKKVDVDDLGDEAANARDAAVEADYVKTYEGPNAKYPKGHKLHIPREKTWSSNVDHLNSPEEEY